jgi:hypothetical protein
MSLWDNMSLWDKGPLKNTCAAFPFIVIPAKAGIQSQAVDWTPAFAHRR